MAEPGFNGDLTAAIMRGAREIGATRLAAAVAAGTGEPVHPDIIRGLEQLTGETYDPETGTWSGDTG
jgi:hypothetical protein